MKNKEKVNLSEEYLRKLKHRFNYKINESPKYHKLVDETEEFDLLPAANEADDEEVENTPEKEGEMNITPEKEGEMNITPEKEVEMNITPEKEGEIGDAPIPAFDQTDDGSEILPTEEIEPSPEEQVDELQNEIIKHNISAMKSIHNELEGLSNVVNNLNTKLEDLNSEVEEVREPTNTEKLMSQKSVSYPYYFNLNDFWADNWFNQKREAAEEKGINRLPDGSYVADFDNVTYNLPDDIDGTFDL